jgi:hypothetical protein
MSLARVPDDGVSHGWTFRPEGREARRDKIRILGREEGTELPPKLSNHLKNNN